MKGAGLIAAGTALSGLAGCDQGQSMEEGAGPANAANAPDPSASLYPVPRNEAYQIGRAVTPEKLNLTYNNFYEFGSQKTIF